MIFSYKNSRILIIAAITFCHIFTNVFAQKHKDTLNLPYMYWATLWSYNKDSLHSPYYWKNSAEVNLVFTGTVMKIYPLSKAHSYNNHDTLFVPQKGIIKLKQLIKAMPAQQTRKEKSDAYNNENYFSSDFFYDRGLKEGDDVVVLVSSYENGYAISGFDGSIIKLGYNSEAILFGINKALNNLQIKQNKEEQGLIGHWALEYKGLYDCEGNKVKRIKNQKNTFDFYADGSYKRLTWGFESGGTYSIKGDSLMLHEKYQLADYNAGRTDYKFSYELKAKTKMKIMFYECDAKITHVYNKKEDRLE